MKHTLARLLGFTAGYVVVILVERVVAELEASERARVQPMTGARLHLVDDDGLEAADVSDVIEAHGGVA